MSSKYGGVGGGNVSVEELNLRLSRDEEWLSGFQEMLGKSATLTGSVCSLLDNFQERIDSLSTNVSTLVAKSSVIQKEQQRIRKLLATVDATIQFHGKTTVLENTIQDGSNVLLNLDDYLEKMRNLKEAIAFFSTHPIYRDQLEHIKQIYEIGCNNIESEFGNLIQSSCVPLDPNKVYDCLDEDYEMPSFRMSSFLTLRDTQRIHQMAAWLLDDGSCTQFLQFYTQFRAENMMKSLRTIADQINSNNRCPKSNFVKTPKNTEQPAFGQPQIVGQMGADKWRKVLRYGRAVSPAQQKMVVMRMRGESMGKSGEGEREPGELLEGNKAEKGQNRKGEKDEEKGQNYEENSEKREEKGMEKGQNSEEKVVKEKGVKQKEKDQFATAVFRVFAMKKMASRIADSADQTHRDNALAIVLFMSSTMLVMVQLETELCSTVFSNVKVEADILRQIVREPLSRVITQAQRVIDAYDGNFALMIPLAKFYLRHSNQLTSLSENIGQRALFSSFQSGLFRKCVQLIKLYLDRLSNDQIGGRFVPEDGNIHPVTSGTINFLKLLVQHQKLLAQIYQRAAEDSQEPTRITGGSATSPSKLFGQILTALSANLQHKCSAYTDPHLGALFMFNNLGYVAQCCTRDKQLLSSLQSNSSLDHHSQLLTGAEAEKYLKRYLESWARIGALFSCGGGANDLDSVGNERKTVKVVFTSFTRDFDAIIEAQKNYCLADQSVAKEVRARIKELVLRPYIDFCTRNSRECSELFETDRQLKYDAETVEMIIDRLFDVTFC